MPDNDISLNHIKKFDGKNYKQWKYVIDCALQAKGVYDVAYGLEAKPKKEDTEKWTKKDAVARYVLLQTSSLGW